MIKKITAIILSLCLCFGFSGCSKEKGFKTSIFAMDTIINLTIQGKHPQESVQLAEKEIKRIENLMSSHIPSSEISLINETAWEKPVKMSEETEYVIKEALTSY